MPKLRLLHCGLLLVGCSSALLCAGTSPGLSLTIEAAFIARVQTWDLNHDGYVTCEEWRTYAASLFEKADSDHDGKLTREEFAKLAKIDWLFEVANFDYYDVNKWGYVTQADFVGRTNPAFAALDHDKSCMIDFHDLRTIEEASRGGGCLTCTPGREQGEEEGSDSSDSDDDDDDDDSSVIVSGGSGIHSGGGNHSGGSGKHSGGSHSGGSGSGSSNSGRNHSSSGGTGGSSGSHSGRDSSGSHSGGDSSGSHSGRDSSGSHSGSDSGSSHSGGSGSIGSSSGYSRDSGSSSSGHSGGSSGYIGSSSGSLRRSEACRLSGPGLHAIDIAGLLASSRIPCVSARCTG